MYSIFFAKLSKDVSIILLIIEKKTIFFTGYKKARYRIFNCFLQILKEWLFLFESISRARWPGAHHNFIDILIVRTTLRSVINFSERCNILYTSYTLPIFETSISLVIPRNNSAEWRRKGTAARSRNAITEKPPPTKFTHCDPEWKISPPSGDITTYSRVTPDKLHEYPLCLFRRGGLRAKKDGRGTVVRYERPPVDLRILSNREKYEGHAAYRGRLSFQGTTAAVGPR